MEEFDTLDDMSDMNVIKRDGKSEIVSFDKILRRIKKLGVEVGIKLNYTILAMKVIDQLHDNISTTKIDELAAEQCAVMSSQHPDYGTLAGRIVVSNHQKNTSSSFYEITSDLYHKDEESGWQGILNHDYWYVVEKNHEEISKMIDYDRDYLIDYFGFKTLERSYLLRINGVIVERPQHLWMRVAIAIHGNNMTRVKETYDLMSQKYFTHATPTLFNAGTHRQQMSSCYLIAMEEDSLDGIFNTLHDCARISKWAGGIGLHIHNIRANKTLIKSTNGLSNGIVPMLKVFNDTARFINQGGKRNGSIAIYMEPWHADIEDFLEMKKNHGDDEMRARDLFYGLWIPDLFMEKVQRDEEWCLFCPSKCPGLSDVYGKSFKEMYHMFEDQGLYNKRIKARDLWYMILDAQMETGTPYLLYKDACNSKSNQKNVGVIKSSNLCVAPETLILTDNGHTEIQSLVDREVTVWNGEEWSSVIVKKTGENQDLIDVYTDDGSILTCTPYHKFYIQNNYSSNSIKIVEAKDLTSDDKIIKCDFPVIDGQDTMKYAYTHGFFCGDGTYGNITGKEENCCNFTALPNHYFCKRHLAYETEQYLFDKEDTLETHNLRCQAMSYSKKPIAYLYGNKKKLLDFIDKRSYTETNDRIALTLPVDLNEKFDIPSYSCSIKNKLDWFAGYCDADGSISRNGDNEQLQVGSINKEFLEGIKLLLQTCGINPKVKLGQNRSQSYLPDGKGGYKYFDVKPLYRLLITSYDLYKLYSLGFNPKRLSISGNKPARDARQFVKILKVENNNRIDDTYCFTEPKRNMGIFNGILTGQCTEIVEFSDNRETAVCNLASIALPAFVDKETKSFNYEKLHEVTKVVARNLNNIIDFNFYPTEKTHRSNNRHRPIGIGVQGLADTFILMDVAFHSDIARDINKNIFETMYHGAIECSHEMAREYGAYNSFVGSPLSEGKFQFDMWNVTPSDRYDWEDLRKRVVEQGVRNSLLIAPMPTASTSQILGYNECFEPFTSNLYSRRTLAGEFVVANKYLMKELIDMGLWNENIKNNIIANKGSVQQLTMLPEHIREKYKIVWEIPMRHVIDMATDRGAFICQSQSMNLWVEEPTYKTLTSMHFYSWKKGLKTGIYYLRRKAKHYAQQFTIEPTRARSETYGTQNDSSNKEKDEVCEMCSA